MSNNTVKLANNVSQFCTFFYIIIILKTKAQFLYMMKKNQWSFFLYHYYDIFSFHRQRNLCVNIFFCKTWWLKHFAAHLNRKKIIWSLLEMTHKCALLSQKKTRDDSFYRWHLWKLWTSTSIAVLPLAKKLIFPAKS